MHSETSRDSFMTTMTTLTTSASAEVDERSRIGRTYMVRRLNGQWLPAEILETRHVESRGNRLEYFVHFENRKPTVFLLIHLSML